MPIGKLIASGHYGDVYEVKGEFLDDGVTPLVCKQIKNSSRSDMFETECAIAHQLSEYATPGDSGNRVITHHVLRTKVSESPPSSTLRLYMERASGTVFELFEPNVFQKLYRRDISEKDWFGTIFQMCHLLATVQAKCRFQHNDMHVQNVFVVNVPKNPIVYAYRVNNQKISMTHRDYIIKLGDYSMAETEQHKNPYVQSERFIRYGIDPKYHPGYDWLVFLLSIYEKRRYFALPESVYIWLKRALSACYPDWRAIVQYAVDYQIAFTRPTLNDMRQVSLVPSDFLDSNNAYAIPFDKMRCKVY